MMGCDIVDDMISNNAISAWEGIRMARLSLLGPLDAPLPQALELLPHSISRYDDLKECMSHLEGVDVVLVEEGQFHGRDEFRELAPADRLRETYREGGGTIILGRPPMPLPLGRTVGGSTF